MRIATFNIWNKQVMWKDRLIAICEEIKKVNPDIISLQEVKACIEEGENLNVAQYIANTTGYPYCIFNEYPDSPDEGIAILSKYPISSEDVIWSKNIKETNYCANRITFKYGSYEYGITNVHLNWKSTIVRDEQIREVHEWILEDNKSYEVLCGDFNDEPNSSIHQYLTNNHWIDAAQLNEEINNIKAQPTLDYINNSNIKNESSLNIQARYDWILLKLHKNLKLPSISVEVFGNKPTAKAQILPSDHYGVVLDIITVNERMKNQ